MGPSTNETNAYGTAKSSKDMQTNVLNQADQEYSQFTGPNMTSSPFYKTLVTTGTDSTTSAYNKAKANMAAKANAAGFGYASPAAATGDNQVEAQEASDVAKVPTQAVQTAADYGLRAAEGLQTTGAQEGQQSLGYEDAGVSLQNTRSQDVNALLRQLISSYGQVSAAAAGRG